MRKLEGFTFTGRSSGKAKHDWSVLLDGSVYELTRGEDYECKDSTLIMMARDRAKKRGLKVRAAKTEAGVVVQAYAATREGATESCEPGAVAEDEVIDLGPGPANGQVEEPEGGQKPAPKKGRKAKA